MSFSLDIEGIVRIHLQDVQTITFCIVVSVNVNVLPEGGQRSVAVYVLFGLSIGAGLGSFQDGRHSSKMASMAPIQDGVQAS